MAKLKRTKKIKRKTVKGVSTAIKSMAKGKKLKDIQFVCIGTDKVVGDSVAPMVGSILEANGYKNVIGTLKKPLHNLNKEERIANEVKDGKFIIAIDASFGFEESVGSIAIENGPITMGAAVRKDEKKMSIGDIAIKPVVEENSGDGAVNAIRLRHTEVSVVYDLATKTADAIMDALPLKRGGWGSWIK